MNETIALAQTEAQYAAYARLITSYVAWCRARYADDAWFIEAVFGYQSLAHELGELQARYGPPHGMTFLAQEDATIYGGGAYQLLPDGSCEMKRLVVSESHRGRGIGRRLCEKLIDSARDAGCSVMRLDTGNRLTEAISLYQSLGFTICPPHRSYPAELMPYLVFMERTLGR